MVRRRRRAARSFINFNFQKTEELYCLATIIVRAEFLPPTNMIAVRKTAAANVTIAAVTAAVQVPRGLRDHREFRDLPVLRVLQVKPLLLQWERLPQELPEHRLPLQIQVRHKMPF